MPSHKHKRLFETLSRLNQEPSDQVSFGRWIAAKDQLGFLNSNAQDGELILYAAGNRFFVHGVAVKSDLLVPLDKNDLMGWAGNPFGPRAGYGAELHDPTIWIDEHCLLHGSKTMEKAQQLVYTRTFEGMPYDSNYCEVLQEFLHLSEIHWQSERSSYCRFDQKGDFDDVVSVTIEDSLILVTVQREPLELYLAASDSILVRMFEFACFRSREFVGWTDEPENPFFKNDELFYRQRINPEKTGYTRGVQIVPLSRPRLEIFCRYHEKLFGNQEARYVDFLAYDWRNKQETIISTNPDATTNYFVADENSLPFETSPAFFRPEVLSKYKLDRDKYTYDEVNRNISCRHLWTLENIGINEAGQVHAYICYLRMLPYEEQVHWLSCNEPMKDGISKRSFETDFEGRWNTDTDSLQDIRPILERWDLNRVPWWTLRRKNLIEQTTAPRTEARHEWGQSFLDLSQLIPEGFVPSTIKSELDEADVPYQSEKSIKLLEKLLVAKSLLKPDEQLTGLRSVNHFRNKTTAHATGSQFDELSKEVLQSFGSYSDHFLDVCQTVCDELLLIEKAFEPNC